MGGFFVVKGINMKKNKTLGIIGGLGPETTAHFYMKVVFACSKISGIRPQIIIANVGVPLKVEKELIVEAKNAKNILPFLISAAKQLEKGGADFIVIPCNTVHLFIEEIRNSVKIPVLSIIEETSNLLKHKNIKEVGVLATTATIKNKLFDSGLENNGIKMLIPNSSNQLKMGSIINHLVNSRQTENDKKKFIKIIEDTNTKNVVLACTDLQILNTEIKNVRIFDTLDILANAAVNELMKQA